MTKMSDVFGEAWADRFNNALDHGMITLRVHPEFPELRIANYTPACAYEGHWYEITLASRGLIFNAETGELLARPFKKFFNYGQVGAPAIAIDAELYAVGDKFDGSLGIGYMRPDGVFAIATRGSFDSEQARHANKLIHEHNLSTSSYFLWYRADIVGAGMTPLFEIIYPENRIVLDYEQQDYLQPIGWIKMDTGAYVAPGAHEGFEQEDAHVKFRDLLARAPRPNSEGWVAWLDPFTAVKLKQEDYVALHAIVTGLNEKSVWRAVQEGPTAFGEFVAKLPDELQTWANAVAARLNIQFSLYMNEIDAWYQAASETAWGYSTGDTVDRKQFALAVQDTVPMDMRGFMFAVADGKDYQGKIWKLLEPKGNVSYRNVPEDAL